MANKSYYDCVGVIQKASGDTLSETQAQELLDQINQVVEAKKQAGSLEGTEQLVLSELDNATNALREAALIEKRNTLINKKVRKELMTRLANFKNPGDGFMAVLGGKHIETTGALNSIDAQGKALTDGMLGKFINSLEKENLLEFYSSGQFDEDIARELWELPNGQPGITGSMEARRIAELVNSMQNELVYRQNRAGAYIKLAPGYIVRQVHDMFRIRKAGYDKWAQEILPLLDHQKTFGLYDKAKFLREAYDGFISGIHFKAKGDSAVDSVTYFLGFKGPSNLAKKVSQERVLHFKDATSWMAYNRTYGTDTLRESILAGVEHASRNIALMENLGTNPLAMVDSVLGDLRAMHKSDTAAIDNLKDYRIHSLYSHLDGTSRIPVYHKVAAIGAGVRVVQNMAKLGGAVLSSITDIPFQAAAMRRNGASLLDAYGNAFTNLLRGRGSAEQREIARLVGVGFDGIIRDIASRFSAEDTIPGRMARLQQKYFKLNLMNWWNDTHKTGVALMLSNHIASLKGKDFSSLPGDLITILRQYDIGEREWNLVSDLTSRQADGHDYFTPDAIHDIPDERLIDVYKLGHIENTSVISRELRKVRDSLELKYRTYFIDQINHAIPHPGAAEQSLLLGPTQPGTVLGEAVRFIAQFKSFPVTVVRKGLAPHLYKDGADNWLKSLATGKADYMGLVHLMVATTVFGYLAGAAKDTARGRTPKDPANPETWVAAMAQGGGLGIYGDFLFGEFNKYGHSAIATLAGPTLSNLEDLARLYSRMKDGDPVAAQSVRITLNNTPFINLFYTRMALDYLVLHQLQESVNPGYLSRLEGRIMKENHQKFYFPPTQSVPYGGGDKLFEGVR